MSVHLFVGGFADGRRIEVGEQLLPLFRVAEPVSTSRKAGLEMAGRTPQLQEMRTQNYEPHRFTSQGIDRYVYARAGMSDLQVMDELICNYPVQR